MSDLLEVECRCGVKVMSSPFSTIEALCMTCRGVDWDVTPGRAVPIGKWHPAVGYSSPGQGESVPAVPRELFPAPVVSLRAATRTTRPLPAPVLKLAEFAREHSWEVRTQYSQGHMPHATTGRPGALKDLIALRFGAHPMTDRQAYAVYSRNVSPSGASLSTWTWGSVMIWGPDLPPYGGCGIEHLKTYLQAPAEVDLEWVADIRALRAAQAAAVKAKPKAPAKPKDVG